MSILTMYPEFMHVWPVYYHLWTSHSACVGRWWHLVSRHGKLQGRPGVSFASIAMDPMSRCRSWQTEICSCLRALASINSFVPLWVGDDPFGTLWSVCKIPRLDCLLFSILEQLPKAGSISQLDSGLTGLSSTRQDQSIYYNTGSQGHQPPK